MKIFIFANLEITQKSRLKFKLLNNILILGSEFSCMVLPGSPRLVKTIYYVSSPIFSIVSSNFLFIIFRKLA